jgi:hypothetical protein
MAMVAAVNGNPTLKYSRKEMATCRLDLWMTMRLATDPSTVRFPASVEDIARMSHARLGSARCGTKGLNTRSGEETRQAEVRNHDHHAKEQYNGIVVDGRIRIIESEHVECDHHAGTYDRSACTIHAKAGQPPDRENQVGTEKDGSRSKHILIFYFVQRDAREEMPEMPSN